jgi:hypothetical protein
MPRNRWQIALQRKLDVFTSGYVESLVEPIGIEPMT